MANPTVLAIGTISCDRGTLTQRCLDSIRKCTKTPYHIYLVDNGSMDETTQQQLGKWEKDPDVTLFRLPQNRGPSAARNTILRATLTRHELFAMLDNDIVVLEGWDQAARRSLAGEYDAIQPKLLTKDGSTVDRGPTAPAGEPWLANPEWIGTNAPRHAPEVMARRANATFGGTSVVRADIYHRIGLYDERLWMAEDWDLSFRASTAGFRIGYEPECEMIHDHEFDLAYDIRRKDIKKNLLAHAVLWASHRKLLLPPDALFLYSYLINANEPLFLTGIPKLSAQGMLRRIRRRCITRWFLLRHGNRWTSERAGAEATARVVKQTKHLLGYSGTLE